MSMHVEQQLCWQHACGQKQDVQDVQDAVRTLVTVDLLQQGSRC